MRGKRLTSESGQTQAEYILVVAGIALACVAAALLISAVLSGRFDSSSKPLTPGSSPFLPPDNPPTVVIWPTTLADCDVNDGWKNFSQFGNQQACDDYVNNLPTP